MSLINEALKRTRDATYQTAASSSDAAPYRVTDVAKSTSFGSGAGRIVVLAVLALVIVMVSLIGRRIASPFKNLEEGLASTPASTVSKQSPPVVQQAQRPVTPVVSQPETKPAASEKAAEVQPAVKAPQLFAPAAPEPPKLVLQGIITAEGNTREAMINGYNVREGEDLDGAKVLSIDAHSVKLLFGDREFTLRLP